MPTAIDFRSKLRHFLQTVLFCIAVAAMLVAFSPKNPWRVELAYSLCIGLTIWAVIDLGRHAFASAPESGWPTGWVGPALVACGILCGWAFGTALADWLCRTFGWYGTSALPTATASLQGSLLVTVLAGIAGSYWFYSRGRSRWLQDRATRAQRQADEARLKLLEAQLEPHMLFNTLANLRALIDADPARAQRMLDDLIAFLRATLDGSRRTTHSLQAEFDRLGAYLALMSVRMGPRLAYSLQLDPSVAAVHVPTLLLQPLVENSIRHGLEPRLEGGRVDVRAWRDSGDVVIEVLDTGVGLREGASAGQGFGIVQAEQRLHTAYGGGSGLRIEPAAGGGTRALIRIPATAATASHPIEATP